MFQSDPLHPYYPFLPLVLRFRLNRLNPLVLIDRLPRLNRLILLGRLDL